MGSATSFTAERMLGIENSTVVNGSVDAGGHLILARRDGTPIDAGYVKGAKGDTGSAGASFTVAAGFIQPFSGSVPPAGWMICNGNELLRAQYPELFSVIGTTYGSSGPLYFNLPDFRGRTLVGQDGSQIEFDVIGKIGGAKTHVLTIAEMPSHSHQWAAAGTTNAGATPANYDDIVGANNYPLGTGPTDPENSSLNAIKPRGGGGAHNNLQPFSVVNYVISLGVNATVGGGNPVVAQYMGRGTAAERNAVYGVPSTDAQKVALANRRVQWYNIELGWVEQYYCTTGLSGLGVPGLYSHASIPSGWYPVGKGPRAHLNGTNTAQALTSGTNYTVWRDWETGSFNMDTNSWKNTPGNANDGSTIFWRQPLNAALQVYLAGRYKVTSKMGLPAGSGTAVTSLRVVNMVGASERISQKPWPLYASYGQFDMNEHSDMLIGVAGYVYYRCDAASMSVGNIESYLDLEYLGPPLVSTP